MNLNFINFGLLLLLTFVAGVVVDMSSYGSLTNEIIRPIAKEMINSTNIDFTGLDKYQARDKILNEFEYINHSKDCKYWAYQWERYAIEYGYDYRYITIPNHIFGVMYINQSYCIVDQNKIMC